MIGGKRLLGILVAAGVTALGNARAQNPVIDWNSATIVVVGTGDPNVDVPAERVR